MRRLPFPVFRAETHPFVLRAPFVGSFRGVGMCVPCPLNHRCLPSPCGNRRKDVSPMKKVTYSVALQKLIDEFSLKIHFMPETEKPILLTRSDIDRPGLPLTGFFGHFEAARVQVIGKSEYEYLEGFDAIGRMRRLTEYMKRRPVTVIVAHDLPVPEDLLTAARDNNVPLLSTDISTSEIMAAMISYLNVQLAPRTTVHGVLVEVYGEGVLITGDSGIGKSETAIELVKRGHRLIADDAVEIKRVSDRTLVGTAPELIRYYIELRGIGIVDVRRIFGMGAVKDTEKIDMNIHLETWVEGKMYDRFGMESQTTDIMGISVPSTLVPVRPGRNLAIIIEIAAMNNRQKKMGYNTAEEFDNLLQKNAGLL